MISIGLEGEETIVIVFAFRCILAEYFLSELLNLKLRKDMILELGMIILFICASWFIDNWLCMVLYFAVYVGYLWIKKNIEWMKVDIFIHFF